MTGGTALPSARRVLFRGLTRRCGRCGAGKLFGTWFKMVDHCPRCGYLFNREEGYFLGALLINFVVTEIVLGVVLAVLIGMLASGNGRSLTPIVVAAVGETLLVPLLFFPFSRTTWAAVDLLLHRGEPWSAQPDPTGVKARVRAGGDGARDQAATVSRAETSTDPSAPSQTWITGPPT